MIGFLCSASSEQWTRYVAGFHQGLKEAGLVESKNVAIEYRWAEGHYDRLPELAADLVSRRVAVLVATGGGVSARAAKSATSTIPIVPTGGDPSSLASLPVSIDRVATPRESALNSPPSCWRSGWSCYMNWYPKPT